MRRFRQFVAANINDAMAFIGIMVIAYGVWRIHEPWGIITAGVGLAIIGITRGIAEAS